LYILALLDVVNNTIAVRAGAHRVAYTFDSGTSTQVSFVKNEHGERVPEPDTAIGILVEFINAHLGSGRGGHFIVRPRVPF
jgi:hypothetical protein